MLVLRPYRSALCDVWYDAVGDPVFSWTFSRRFPMESTRLCGVVRVVHLQCLRVDRFGYTRAALADCTLDTSGKEVRATHCYYRPRAKLGVSLDALATILRRLRNKLGATALLH